jgi:hypothetical protein
MYFGSIAQGKKMFGHAFFERLAAGLKLEKSALPAPGKWEWGDGGRLGCARTRSM